MINEINEMKNKLEQLLITYDLDNKLVIETSKELDILILEYYSRQNISSEFDVEKRNKIGY